MFILYHRKLSGHYEHQWPGTGISCSHTSNIVPERLTERVWWTKSQSSLPNYFRFIGPTYSLPLRSEYLFTLHQRVEQNLSDMWRSTFEIGAAQLHSVAEVTALMCEQKSYPVEQFSYDLEMKTREQNRNNKRTEIERFDWFIEWIQTRAAFGWLSER